MTITRRFTRRPAPRVNLTKVPDYQGRHRHPDNARVLTTDVRIDSSYLLRGW
jgi:hypothetical protein